VAAHAAATEALKHQDEVERRVTATIGDRLELERGLRKLNVWLAESDANFMWLRLADEAAEADVVAGLRERGVLVRAGSALGREGALRITVGTAAENAKCVAALDELLLEERTGRR
jgi:histidinol-phosphate aminotransferase